jgi:polyisoprenoid-binding protein YceI
VRTLSEYSRLLCLAALPALAAGATYQIDPAHSGAQFTVRHMMVSNVKGNFTKLTGTVEFDPKNLKESKVEAIIDATSIDTREPKRDAHLKSADFFDVANFPTITFRSRSIEPAGAGKYKVVGDLTMRGVTKEVALDVDGPTAEVQMQNTFRTGASATTHVNRKDFGVSWNRALDAGGVVVGEDVTISLDVELIRKAAAPAAPAAPAAK